MRIKTFHCCLVFWILFLAGSAKGQVAYAPEKVFVHLDRTYFAAGETMWMKGYVESAVPVPDTSRFLYVELLDEKGEARLRSKIRFSPEEGFAGHLDLPDDISGGRYTLRAYTRWQLNWPEERMFHVPVDIYDGKYLAAKQPDDKSSIDVSFYPEGGRYFNGVLSSVGFKVMASDGRGLTWNGVLYDDLGNRICDCRTEHAGMGLIGFIPVEGRRYRLVDEADGQAWDLPAAASEGASLLIRRTGDHFAVQVVNRSGAPVVLSLRSGGETVALSRIDGTGQTLRVPASASGLQKFLLSDDNGRILAERPVFVEAEDMTAAVSVSYENPDYVPRKKWNLSLAFPDGADIDSAELSVSVVRGAFRPYQQEGNLTSYMLLGSEVRGFIEQPDYYFDPKVPASTRMNHLDLLLMIQGWTYYDEAEMVAEVAFPKEEVQAIRGEVRSVFRTQPRKFLLTWMAPELNYTQATSIDKGSRFMVDSLDFPESTLFIVVVDKGGTRKPYYPVVDEDFAPKPSFPVLSGWGTKSRRGLRPASTVGDLPLPDPESAPAFQQGDVQQDTIQTAVIQAIAPRIRTPFGSSELSNIKEQKDFITYANYNLLSYIIMTNPSLRYTGEDVINLKTGYLSELQPAKAGTEEEDAKFNKVSLYVNGAQMPWDMAESILMGDVQKLSVTTEMNSDAFIAKSFGGIVLVELAEGGAPKSLHQQTNTLVFRPLGWQRPKAFYNPVNDRHRTLALPDRRNTVYWNPAVRLGASGSVTLPLMTEDRADGPYFIRIEGRTADGRWISTTQVLD